MSSVKVHPHISYATSNANIQRDEWDSSSSDISYSEEPVAASSRTPNLKASCLARNLVQERKVKQDKIVEDIMNIIIPDIGQYDIDGLPQSSGEDHRPRWKRVLIEWLKILGCWQLTVFEAIMTGYPHLVSHAIKKLKDKNLVNAYDYDGRTALSIAIKTNSVEIIEILLKNGALPDIVERETCTSPLLLSVNMGLHPAIKMLLASGASVNLCDSRCITPLMIASYRDDNITVNMLCHTFADLNAQDENGWTALHYAAYGNASKCILMLLSDGANRNIRDKNERKPIHIARYMKHGVCVNVLEDMKAKMDYASGEDF